MGTALLFFLVLAVAAPLLLAAQNKTSTVWINNDVFFDGLADMRYIVSSSVQSQTSFAAGFFCVSPASSLYTCHEFLFAVSITGTSDGEVEVVGTEPPAVWSANRDRPVGENATLELTTHGNLVLRDADGSHVWSSNSSGRSSY